MRTLFLISSFVALFSAYGLEIAQVRKFEQVGRYTGVLELCKKTPEDAFSMYFISDYLYHGRKGIKQNQALGRESYQKAIPELTDLAEKGNIDAQYYLGRCYEYGENDSKSARKWYIKAADNGNSDAMITAAMFIAKRRGGGKTDPQAVMTYIQKAITAGNPDGKALLASFHLEGRKDIEKGIILAKEAAEQKSPLGQMILGGIYLRGIGTVKRDEEKALEFFQQSSDQGNSAVNEVLEQLKKKLHANDRKK